MKKEEKLIEYEFNNELIIASLIRALKETPNCAKLNLDTKELFKITSYPQDFTRFFTLAYSQLLNLLPPEIRKDLPTLNLDVEGLAQGSMELVTRHSKDIFHLAFVELAFFAVAVGAKNYLENISSNSEATNEISRIAPVIDWWEKKRRQIINKILNPYTKGGREKEEVYNSLEKLVQETQVILPLWRGIRDFQRKHSIELPNLEKELQKNVKSEKFQNGVKEFNFDTVKEVIKEVREYLIKHTNARRIVTPISLACLYTAKQLGIKYKSPQTLLRLYNDVKGKRKLPNPINPIVKKYHVGITKDKKLVAQEKSTNSNSDSKKRIL